MTRDYPAATRLAVHVGNQDVLINDNLVRGIAEPEIISDVLGDPKMDRTLEETVSFIVTRSAVGDCAGATCNTTKPKLLTRHMVSSAGHV